MSEFVVGLSSGTTFGIRILQQIVSQSVSRKVARKQQRDRAIELYHRLIATNLCVWIDSPMSQKGVHQQNVAVVRCVVARRVAESITGVGFGAAREQLVETGGLVAENGEVESSATKCSRLQMDVTVFVE